MANYRSYRKVSSDMLTAGTIDPTKLVAGVTPDYCVKMFYGHPCYCTPGCCCYWQVPSGVGKLTIEMWGAGVTDTEHVLATDVITTEVPLVVHIILRQLLLVAVANILYVLVEFTDVVQENVMDVKDVHLM